MLTVACSWASLLKPHLQQAILSFHQSTKHEPHPLFFTYAWQAANQGHCSTLWPLCSVLSQPMYPIVQSKNSGQEDDCQSNSITSQLFRQSQPVYLMFPSQLKRREKEMVASLESQASLHKRTIKYFTSIKSILLPHYCRKLCTFSPDLGTVKVRTHGLTALSEDFLFWPFWDLWERLGHLCSISDLKIYK